MLFYLHFFSSQADKKSIVRQEQGQGTSFGKQPPLKKGLGGTIKLGYKIHGGKVPAMVYRKPEHGKISG
jgi:hypothetical protein